MLTDSSPEDLDNKKLKFPPGFLWGAATASHQVEGNTHNDWSQWEKENAERLSREAKSKFGYLPNWPEIEKEANNSQNYISGMGANHFKHYKEDFALAKDLGHSATRFSLEWSRLEPTEGIFDEEAFNHYLEVIKTCRENGLEPFVTLWHFTLPLWLSKKGGVLNQDFPRYFENYCGKAIEKLGSEIKFWITLNEPDVLTSHAYIKGLWPPERRSFIDFYLALRNLIKAHKLAYRKIKQKYKGAKVGIAKHQVSFVVLRKNPINFILKGWGNYFWNRFLLNQIKNYQDFIGLNHYNRNVVDNGFGKNPNKTLTDLGWEFYPQSIYQSLIELKPYRMPIYVTENGLADSKDKMRGIFLKESLRAVSDAIKRGADVKGYLHWSLMDNFEWDKGFWPRFGLIEIDYKTEARRPRPSAYLYKKIIEESK